MGLDAYFFAQDNSNTNEASREDNAEELCYWRKHANLQGYMTDLAVRRGITTHNEGLNVTPVPLSEDDLVDLQEAITRGLPLAGGFFWGASRPEDDKTVLEAIKVAKERIAEGLSIIYYCWW